MNDRLHVTKRQRLRDTFAQHPEGIGASRLAMEVGASRQEARNVLYELYARGLATMDTQEKGRRVFYPRRSLPPAPTVPEQP